MDIRPPARIGLLSLQGLVTLTAAAGGAALIVGTLAPDSAVGMVPAARFLDGSPFDSYLIPGLILAIVLGGTQLVAFLALLRRHRWAMFLGAGAGFATLIWIFVQMIVIPFSALQTVYFLVGLAELGLVLLLLGVLEQAPPGAAGI